jgi:hypothetical protein
MQTPYEAVRAYGTEVALMPGNRVANRQSAYFFTATLPTESEFERSSHRERSIRQSPDGSWQEGPRSQPPPEGAAGFAGISRPKALKNKQRY